MTKNVFLILLLLLPSFLAAETSSEPVRLGVTVPLTGDYASYGNLINKGVELAAEDLRAEGHLVEIKSEDACIPSQAVSSIHKLIALDRIHILAANFCILAIPAMAPILERNQIISFHTATASDSILASGEFIFATNGRVRDEAKRMAEHAYNSLGARTASILHITGDFGEDYNRYFSERFKELGGKIPGSYSSPIGVNDFRSDLTKIRFDNPDVIFAAHLGLNLGVLLRQARVIGLTQKILGVYEAEDTSVLEMAGEHAEGLRFYVPGAAGESEEAKGFHNRFQQRYKQSPGVLASNAYDATILAVRALVSCKSNPDCAKDKIYSVRNYRGVSGVFSIDANGGAQRDFVLKEVQGGKFKPVVE